MITLTGRNCKEMLNIKLKIKMNHTDKQNGQEINLTKNELFCWKRNVGKSSGNADAYFASMYFL